MGENEEMRIMGNDSGKCYSVSIKRCKEIMQSVTIKVCYVGFESIKVDAKNKNKRIKDFDLKFHMRTKTNSSV